MLRVLFSQVHSSGGLQVFSSISIFLTLDQMDTLRSTFLFCMITLLGGTFLFCFGRSLGVYIFARLLQGISSAGVWIVGFIPLRMHSC